MKLLQRVLALSICFCMVFEQSGFAQVAPQIIAPAYLSGKLPAERFRPLHLRSVSIDPEARSYGLILDKGDNTNVRDREVVAASKKLLEYFKVGLRLPNEKFWVNLRPDTDQGIIDPYLERTDMGKIFLAADVQLKKDVARFTSPDTKTGREYWNRLYEKAADLFGADEDVEIPTVTRPWIVPGEVVLARTPQGAYVYKAIMQVKLEEDWLNTPAGAGLSGYPSAVSEDPRVRELNAYSSRLLRELVIPQLTREVNSSKRYSELRQVFYSLVLAQWFKRSKRSQAQAVEAVDSLDLTGISSRKAWSKQDYYRAYRTSFTRGEYNKEERVVTRDGITIRRYFSGGIDATDVSSIMMNRPGGVGLTPDMAGVVVSENGAVDVQPPIDIGSPQRKDGGVALDQKRKIEAFSKKVAVLTDSEITVEKIRELLSASGIQIEDSQVMGLLKKRLSKTTSPWMFRNAIVAIAISSITAGLLGANILSIVFAAVLVGGVCKFLLPVAPGAKLAKEYLDGLDSVNAGIGSPQRKDGGVDRDQKRKIKAFTEKVAAIGEGVDRDQKRKIKAFTEKVAAIREGVDRDQERKIAAFTGTVAALTESEITVEKIRELLYSSGIQRQDPQVMSVLKYRLSQRILSSKKYWDQAMLIGIICLGTGILAGEWLLGVCVSGLVLIIWRLFSPVAPGAKFAKEYLDGLDSVKEGAFTEREITIKKIKELLSDSGIQIEDPQVRAMLKKQLNRTISSSMFFKIVTVTSIAGIVTGLLSWDPIVMMLTMLGVYSGSMLLAPAAPGAKLAKEYLDGLDNANAGSSNKDGGLIGAIVNEPINLYYAVTAVWSVLIAVMLHSDRSVIRGLPYGAYVMAGVYTIIWGIISYCVVGYLDEGIVAQGAAVLLGSMTGNVAGTWLYKITGGEYDGGIIEGLFNDPMSLYAALSGVFALITYYELKTLPVAREALTPEYSPLAGINAIIWGFVSYVTIEYLGPGWVASFAAVVLGWITGNFIGIWLYRVFGGNVESGIKYMRIPVSGADKTKEDRDDGVIQQPKKDGGFEKKIGVPVPAEAGENKKLGGIDFRAAITEQSRLSTVPSDSVPVLSPAQLEKSWAGIAAQLSKGVVPYAQVKSYILACERGRDNAKLARAVMSINTILRFEEDAACTTSPQMRDILMVLQ